MFILANPRPARKLCGGAFSRDIVSNFFVPLIVKKWRYLMLFFRRLSDTVLTRLFTKKLFIQIHESYSPTLIIVVEVFLDLPMK